MELAFIAILALIVLGPERLPGVIRQILEFVRKAREITSELTSQFSEELNALDEINPQKIINEITEPVKDLNTKNIMNDLTEPVKDIQPKKIAKDIADAAKGKSKPAVKTTEKKSENTAEIADASVDVADASTSDERESDESTTGAETEAKTETGKRKSLPTPKKLSSTTTKASATSKKSTLTSTSQRPALGETMPGEDKPANEPANQSDEDQPKAVQMSKVNDTEPENSIMPPQPDTEAVTADAA